MREIWNKAFSGLIQPETVAFFYVGLSGFSSILLWSGFLDKPEGSIILAPTYYDFWYDFGIMTLWILVALFFLARIFERKGDALVAKKPKN